MNLWTKRQLEQLERNGRDRDTDHVPVVKWFHPAGSATWLITSVDPDDHSMAFGLADLGVGFPEVGWIHVPEIREFRGRFGLGIERDRHFEGKAPLTAYADAASSRGYIVTSPRLIGVEEIHSGS